MTRKLPGPPMRGMRPQASQWPMPTAAERAAPVALETAHYRMRSMRPADASPELQAWLADPDLVWGLNLAVGDWPLDKMRAFIDSFDNRRRYLVGIRAKEPEALIGFYTLDVNPTHRNAHVSVGIGNRDFWGRGVLVETTPVLLDHLFDHRAIEKVTARIVPTNRRVLFNLMNSKRFFYEGRLIGELRTPSGERRDLLSFAALKGRIARP